MVTRPATRAVGLGVCLGASLFASSAHADVLGPVAPRTDCPRGSRSEEVGGGHGHFAACVPNLAREDWACTDGRRIEVVGLEIGTRHVGPVWDGRRGPMPPEMRSMGTDYVVVEGVCDPAPSAAVVEGFVMPAGVGTVGAPAAQGIPVGCQRVRVWIPDDGFRCAPADPTPPPITPSTSPAAPAPASPASPAGCGCSAARTTGPTALWWTGAMALAFLLRRRRAAALSLAAVGFSLGLASSVARADVVHVDPCEDGWTFVHRGHGGACEPMSCEPTCSGECVEVARCFETTSVDRGDAPPEDAPPPYERPLPSLCDAHGACPGAGHCMHVRECRPSHGSCSASPTAALPTPLWPALVLVALVGRMCGARACRRRRLVTVDGAERGQSRDR